MMTKNYFILTVLLLIVALANSQQTVGIKTATSVEVDGDILRSYSFFENLIIPGFTLTGISLGGSLLNGSSVSLDTSIFKLSTAGFPTYFFNYFNFEASVDTKASASATTIASLFTPTFIVEYEETNGEEGFQYGSDKLLGYVNLKQLIYSISYVKTTLKTPEDKPFEAYQVTLSSKNNLFQMVFYVSGAPIELGGNRLTAEQSKVDILINGYYNASVNPTLPKDCTIDLIIGNCASTGFSVNANSRLALASFYATLDLGIEVSGSGKIEVSGSELNAGFSWVGNAEVSVAGSAEVKTINIIANATASGNAGVDFGSSSLTGQFGVTGKVNSQFLIHSFDVVRPERLLWDPSMGISVDNSASAALYSFALICSFVLLALLI